MTRSPTRVLFLCTGNSARSQMAEGWLRALGGGNYDVCSAGTAPKGLHARAVEVMAEAGVDIAGHVSENVDGYRHRAFDCVITVCDHAREQCPVFPGARSLHWSFPDPAEVTGPGQLDAFRRARDVIRARVRRFLAESATAVPG